MWTKEIKGGGGEYRGAGVCFYVVGFFFLQMHPFEIFFKTFYYHQIVIANSLKLLTKEKFTVGIFEKFLSDLLKTKKVV